MNSNYDPVAGEYYDIERHPTSNDFSMASRLLIHDYIRNFPPKGIVCEVGAGFSENIRELALVPSIDNILVTDISERMLSYSRERFKEIAEFLVCDAKNIPVSDKSIDLLISSLGDPYNTPEFWREADRVLTRNGEIFFTTPSWDWAKTFRSQVEGEKPNKALFINKAEEHIYLDSYILDVTRQTSMIEKFDFRVRRVEYFKLSQFGENDTISPKLSGYLTPDTPIVTSYCVVRKGVTR